MRIAENKLILVWFDSGIYSGGGKCYLIKSNQENVLKALKVKDNLLRLLLLMH